MSEYRKETRSPQNVKLFPAWDAQVDPAVVLALLNRLDNCPFPVHAVLLMRHGKLICEGYYHPFEKGMLHRMFSICKSLNALALGILEADGRFSLDDKITDFFPDKLPETVHPYIRSMRVRDMLMMRTCHASTTYKIAKDMDWTESFFKVAPTHRAGTVFRYDTSAAHVLCQLAERLSGRPMLDFLKDRALREIGWSEESYVLPNQYGEPQGGSGLMCTPMDLLLLGQLLLQKGRWNGKQLLPADFLEKAVSCLTPTLATGPIPEESCGYGYQIWRGRSDSFFLYGMGGQLVICCPGADLVCVFCSDSQTSAGGNQYLFDALWETVLASINGSNMGGAAAAGMPSGDVQYSHNSCREKSGTDNRTEADSTGITLHNQTTHSQETHDTSSASLAFCPHENTIRTSLAPCPHENTSSESPAPYSHRNAETAGPDPNALAYRMQHLALRAVKSPISFAPETTVQADVRDVSYVCAEPDSDFTDFTLSFSEDGKGGDLLYHYRGQECRLPFGLGECRPGIFPGYSFQCYTSAAWLAPDTFIAVCQIIDTSIGSVSFELAFRGDLLCVSMRKKEETLLSEYNRILTLTAAGR